MGFFKVSNITDLNLVSLEQQIPESDYAALTDDGKFVQLKYVEDENKKDPYKVKPGIWSIQKTQNGLELLPTSFVKDEILEDLISTQEVEEAIDCFINNVHLYKEFGIEVAKRNILLYGPQGTGKSTSLSKIANKYVSDKKTAVVVWHTAKWESYIVKDFIQSFEYENVERLILIAEDLGGVEKEQSRMASDSSLLSLLDNQEKTFTLPTCIIATTNFPAMFMANVADRPGRFDDKIEVGHPTAESRVKLLKFFTRNTADQDSLDLIADKKCEFFSPAHIRESYIRSRLKSKPLHVCIKQIINEITKYNNGFEKSRKAGISMFGDDEE